ncbi:MAG TPA: hypothetical protein VGF39_05875 [Stellaceae bacterium]|jgi:hypothetical protein
MDYVSAKIQLGGEVGHVMYRGPDNPVSWPEVRVLQHLHGDESVYDCDFAREAPATAQMEKMRLLSLYGAEAVNMVYPGQRPIMDMTFPGEREPEGQKRPEKRLPPTDEPPPAPPLKRTAKVEV